MKVKEKIEFGFAPADDGQRPPITWTKIGEEERCGINCDIFISDKLFGTSYLTGHYFDLRRKDFAFIPRMFSANELKIFDSPDFVEMGIPTTKFVSQNMPIQLINKDDNYIEDEENIVFCNNFVSRNRPLLKGALPVSILLDRSSAQDYIGNSNTYKFPYYIANSDNLMEPYAKVEDLIQNKKICVISGSGTIYRGIEDHDVRYPGFGLRPVIALKKQKGEKDDEEKNKK